MILDLMVVWVAVLVWFWFGSGLVLVWFCFSFGAATSTIRDSGPLAACT